MTGSWEREPDVGIRWYDGGSDGGGPRNTNRLEKIELYLRDEEHFHWPYVVICQDKADQSIG